MRRWLLSRTSAASRASASRRWEARSASGGARDVVATLQYQRTPAPDERVGRYIGFSDEQTRSRPPLTDVHVQAETLVADARVFVSPPTLATRGFELRRAPTKATADDLADASRAAKVYYPEVETLVKTATGCEHVLVFDHTLRESGSKVGLNALGGPKTAAAPVNRVHCDYTEASGHRRVLDVLRFRWPEASEAELKVFVDDRRVAIVNVWRAVPGFGVIHRSPLAVCDPHTVCAKDRVVYTMVYPDRVGGNYALTPSAEHAWCYFPDMTETEALLFSVWDSGATEDSNATGDSNATEAPNSTSTPAFVFHTAFHDPTTRSDVPARRSVEARGVAVWGKGTGGGKRARSVIETPSDAASRTKNTADRPIVFYDMPHSNNAARIRIWLALKGLPNGAVTTKAVAYDDLATRAYAAVNPMRKVPALIDARGGALFESSVCLDYLEDKFCGLGSGDGPKTFRPNTPEQRAHVAKLVRVHDLYIASPNSTQPGFAHTQGAMYLGPHEVRFFSNSQPTVCAGALVRILPFRLPLRPPRHVYQLLTTDPNVTMTVTPYTPTH